MKKFFSLVLALVMAMSLTTMAWGAEVEIDDVSDFTTLSYNDGDTLKLVANIDGTVVFNKSVTLDLNGYTMSSSDDTISVTSAGVVLTIKDSVGTGKVTSNGSYRGPIYVKNGKIIVDSGTFEGTLDGKSYAAYISTNGTLVVNGGTLKATGAPTAADAKIYGVVVGTAVTAPATSCGATLEVNGGTISAPKGIGITGNGNWPGTTITIKGGTVTGNVAIYHPQNGSLTISGGSISGATGVYVKSGTVSVTGGTIEATGSASTYSYNGNGPSATGDALVVDNCNYPGPAPAVSVTGGSFESASGAPVASYVGNGVADADKVVDFIAGGSFDSDVSDYLAAGVVLDNGVVKTDISGAGTSYNGLYLKGTNQGDVITPYTVSLGYYAANAPKYDEDTGAYTALGNVAYFVTDALAYSGMYVQVSSLAEADVVAYADADGKIVKFYLDEVSNVKYLDGAVFTNFGKACGQVNYTATAGVTYYTAKGVDFAVRAGSATGDWQLMVNGKLVSVDGIPVATAKVGHKVVTESKDGKYTSVYCSACKAVAVKANNFMAMPEDAVVAVQEGAAYWYFPAFASAPSTDKVESAETFDAGIAMYVGMSVMAAAGSAVVLKKKD